MEQNTESSDFISTAFTSDNTSPSSDILSIDNNDITVSENSDGPELLQEIEALSEDMLDTNNSHNTTANNHAKESINDNGNRNGIIDDSVTQFFEHEMANNTLRRRRTASTDDTAIHTTITKNEKKPTAGTDSSTELPRSNGFHASRSDQWRARQEEKIKQSVAALVDTAVTKTPPREPSRCCLRCVAFVIFVIVVGLWGIYVTKATARGPYASLAPRIVAQVCHSVPIYQKQILVPKTDKILAVSHPERSAHPTHNYNQHLYKETFLNRTIDDYVRSMRYHLVAQKIIGITAYHVGVPLCMLAFRDRLNHTRILYNPQMVGATRDHDTVDISETDIVCPEVPAKRIKRYRSVTVQHDHITEDFITGRDTQSDDALPVPGMREVFSRSDAIIVQHLIDTLENKNLCNS